MSFADNIDIRGPLTLTYTMLLEVDDEKSVDSIFHCLTPCVCVLKDNCISQQLWQPNNVKQDKERERVNVHLM